MRLVTTQTSGVFDKVREFLYPNIKKYAAKCQADFIPIEECLTDCAVMQKLCIHDFFNNYDRILLLDADLIIRPDCPDLFQLIPPTQLAAYDEGAACPNMYEMYERIKSVAHLATFYGLPQPCFDKSYFSFYNAGIMLLSRCHQHIFEAPPNKKNPGEATVCPEQVYINYNILKYKPAMYSLPVCFNQMPWNWPINYKESSYIVHYAGIPLESRINLMKKDLAYWENKIK